MGFSMLVFSSYNHWSYLELFKKLANIHSWVNEQSWKPPNWWCRYLLLAGPGMVDMAQCGALGSLCKAGTLFSRNLHLLQPSIFQFFSSESWPLDTIIVGSVNEWLSQHSGHVTLVVKVFTWPHVPPEGHSCRSILEGGSPPLGWATNRGVA